MTDKEKEAIEVLKNVDINLSGNIICKECVYPKNATCIINNKDCQINAIETVLNLLEKKDKIIYEMAKYIQTITVNLKIPIGENMFWNIEEIIKNFERKIK